MSAVTLSPKIRAKLEQLFSHEQKAMAVALLETECGDRLPLIENQGSEGIERIRCAALKISNGSMEKLLAAVQLANSDWRDVLNAAGFSDNPLAHLSWLQSERLS